MSWHLVRLVLGWWIALATIAAVLLSWVSIRRAEVRDDEVDP